MKSNELIFREQYKKFSKQGHGVNWAKLDDVIESPNYELVMSCMGKSQAPLLKILKEMGEILENIMNPDYDFMIAYDELRDFRNKYFDK